MAVVLYDIVMANLQVARLILFVPNDTAALALRDHPAWR